MFSNKSKTLDAKWKIEIFTQDKKYIYNWVEGWNRWHVCYILTKEEHPNGDYQDNIRLSTNGSIRDA